MHQFIEWAADMRRTNAPLRFNDEGWRFAAESLHGTTSTGQGEAIA
jgi:hypothetical protein